MPLLALLPPSPPSPVLPLVACLLFALVAGCSSQDSTGGCAPGTTFGPGGGEHPPFTLIEGSEGLGPTHTEIAPLLERLTFIPAPVNGDPPHCSGIRVYPDGAFYILPPRESECGGAWLRLTSLTDAGTAELQALFASLCGEVDLPPADTHGALIYRVTSDRCTREFVVVGIPTHAASRLVEATDDILTRTARTIAADPAPAPDEP